MCAAIGLCIIAWVSVAEPDPAPIVHSVKTEIVSPQPEPAYPCGQP